MRKSIRLLLFAIVALIGLVACGTTNPVDEENQGEKETVDESNETSETDETSEGENAQGEPIIMNDLGIYVGQADPHTVEIETNEGSKAFQLTEQSSAQIKELQANDKVRFEYYVNEHEQNVLQSIEKMTGTTNEDEPETGIYNGQQDPHTIEIETADGPTAFQLSDKAREQVESLEIGKSVSFTYRVEGPQLIIESIKQSEE